MDILRNKGDIESSSCVGSIEVGTAQKVSSTDYMRTEREKGNERTSVKAKTSRQKWKLVPQYWIMSLFE